MRILPATPESLPEAVRILRGGGIVAYPTETCYGFAVDMTNPDAVAKLFALKKRPLDQPVSALFPDVDMAKQYVKWNEKAEKLASQFLPGPLTLILPLRTDAHHLLINQSTNKLTNSMGVRVSSHPFARQLASAFGKPISTTSANLHGQPNPYSIDDIQKQFGDEALRPDLVIDAGPLEQTPPSTIIDLTNTKNSRTLRKGTV